MSIRNDVTDFAVNEGLAYRRRNFRCLDLVTVCTTAAIIVFVSPAVAEVPVEQTWNKNYSELVRQIDRLKQSDKNFRSRLKSEALDRQALILP
ncbi:MAG: hypothetical protein QGF59_16045, partial [Pirellulaceae bacterium]|nr:hypothetical protein [Pirellulaceae bacterium]